MNKRTNKILGVGHLLLRLARMLILVPMALAAIGFTHPSDFAFASETQEIVCWGDSMTEGVGASTALIDTGFCTYDASNKGYPEILAELTGLPTYNFGVSGAKSDEIAFMQGALSKDELEEGADSEERSDYINDAVIQQGRKHPGDVLVLEIGSNGGWGGDYRKLISQYHAMIDHAGCSSYIIIGDTDDPGTSIADTAQKPFDDNSRSKETAWEQALSKEFGNHFINMRLYLIEHGLADAGFKSTSADEQLANHGCISKRLRSDWTHLNSYGYYAQAKAVFEQGIKLGYWTVPFNPDSLGISVPI